MTDSFKLHIEEPSVKRAFYTANFMYSYYMGNDSLAIIIPDDKINGEGELEKEYPKPTGV